MSLQDKFQITVPGKIEDGEGWADASSARSTGEAGFMHSNNSNAAAECDAKFNFLPPGMDGSNQVRKRIQNMPLSVAGETDVSKDTNSYAFECGFTRKDMKGSDDLYSGEHIDLFYGVAVGQDDSGETYEGFVERQNYLDRN